MRRGSTLETRKSPAFATPCVGGRSTELSSNESGDGTTEVARICEILGLGEDADDRLGSGRTDEDSAAFSLAQR